MLKCLNEMLSLIFSNSNLLLFKIKKKEKACGVRRIRVHFGFKSV